MGCSCKYDYDSETGILEVSIKVDGKTALNKVLTGEHAQTVLKEIRKLKDKPNSNLFFKGSTEE